jgi:hypothetical protein
MKLTNQEIDALVGAIQASEKAKIEKFNEELFKNPSKQNVERARKHYKSFISVPAEIRAHIRHRDTVTEKDFLNAVLYPKKKTYANRTTELRNNVILVAMQSKDIIQLKKNLNIK